MLYTYSFAQAYTITHFQSSYDTLPDYNSATIECLLEEGSANYWEKNFEFGFDFPYFGTPYSNFFWDSDAIAYFPNTENYNMYLFSASYMVGQVLDTTYLSSEVRYANTEINNTKAFVIEYHNVYNSDEYNDSGANHYLNFQAWFYENGVIEIHFGDIDLANCSYYFPGQGFSFDNLDPTDNLYGPWITISTDDYSESACIFDDHNNPTIIYDDDYSCGVLSSIPPEGFIIRFAPSDISTTEGIVELKYQNYKIQTQNGIIEILGDLNKFNSCTAYDLTGRKIGYSETNMLHLISNDFQILMLVVESDYGQESHKIVIK